MMVDLDVITSATTIVAQLGLAAGAWRLASQLKERVDNHEHRIKTLEAGKKKKRRSL